MSNRTKSERKIKRNFGTSKFEYSEGPLGDVLRTSWEGTESTFQGRPLNVRLRHPQDDRSRRPEDGQIRSLWNVLVTLDRDVLGTSWGPIFPDWVVSFLLVKNVFNILLFTKMVKKLELYAKCFQEWVQNLSFLIKNNEFLEKYSEICGKVRNSIKNGLILNLYTMKHM